MHPYLNNRQFKVRFLDTTTTVFPIEAGVLYDSVLGPILYSIYTTDTLANVATAAFVDDIAVLAADEKPEVASSVLQEHLDKIVKWCYEWHININESKSTHVTFILRKRTCQLRNMLRKKFLNLVTATTHTFD